MTQKVTIAELRRAGLGKVSNSEVARRCGVSRQRVAQLAKRVGLLAGRERATERKHRAWAAALRPFARSRATIAETAAALGWTYARVQARALQFGLHLRNERIKVEDWTTLDWTLDNTTLAERIGVQRQIVASARWYLRTLREHRMTPIATVCRLLGDPRRIHRCHFAKLRCQLAEAGWPEIPPSQRRRWGKEQP